MMERVKIVGNHPHSGESGTLTGEVLDRMETLGRMFHVHLENCPHGVEGCYAAEANVRRERGARRA